jgi:hypothetical protein
MEFGIEGGRAEYYIQPTVTGYSHLIDRMTIRMSSKS